MVWPAQKSALEWILRLGVAGEFLGHGLLALGGKKTWLVFFQPFGIDEPVATVLLRCVGALDVALAVVVLVRPIPALLAWMAFWALFTAALRPLSGQSWLAFVERGANWAAPLALLLTIGLPSRWRDWWPWAPVRGVSSTSRSSAASIPIQS